jgi:hypothetical protein
MEKPITTIEALAAMINTHMASKEDITRVEVRLDGIVMYGWTGSNTCCWRSRSGRLKT